MTNFYKIILFSIFLFICFELFFKINGAECVNLLGGHVEELDLIALQAAYESVGRNFNFHDDSDFLLNSSITSRKYYWTIFEGLHYRYKFLFNIESQYQMQSLLMTGEIWLNLCGKYIDHFGPSTSEMREYNAYINQRGVI